MGVAATAGALLVAACSSGDDPEAADVTLPNLRSTTTTTAPSPQGGVEGRDQAPRPEWTVQVGGPGNDVLAGLASRDDLVVAVGSTTAATVAMPSPTDDGSTTTAPPSTAPPTSAPAPGAGGQVLVASVDDAGELQTVRTGGSDGDDAANGITLSGEHLVACGSTTGQLGTGSGGGADLWCSLLGEGEPVLSGPIQYGGSDDEGITGVAGDDEGERGYTSGRASGFLPGAQDPSRRGLGGGDAIALQLGDGATPVWARQFGTPFEDAALGVALSPDGDGILVGYTDGDLGRTSSGGRDAWITRFDPSGRQRWITQFGSTGSDVATGVTTAGEASRGTEQFIAVGTTDWDLGGAGSGERRDRLAPDEGAPDEGASADGELGGMSDAFAAAFGPDGSLAWTRTLGSEAEERGAGVVADGATIYVAGTTQGELGELLVDTGPGGGSDGFLAALDAASGEVLWIARFGSTGDEEITGITTTESGLLVLSGRTTGQMATTTPGGGVDGFLIAFPLQAAGGGAASSV